MQSNYLTRPIKAILLCLALLTLPGVAWCAGLFEGSFSWPSIFQLRLKQVGDRVCGEWDFVTSSQNREGLVVGLVHGGILTLTTCPDFEISCTPTIDKYSKPDRFVIRGKQLELVGGNGDGINQRFVRISRTSPKWNNSQSPSYGDLLESCKW